MNDSWANVFCKRAGERSGPVQNGDTTSCDRTRSLRTLPVPPLFPLTVPVIYEGAALLLLAKFVGSGAGVLAANAAGWKPARNPVTTFPGFAVPGRLPNVGDPASQSHAMIVPVPSIPARWSIP